MKKRSAITFIASAVLIVLIAYILSFGLNVGDYRINSLASAVKLGLDLKGGVSIEEEAVGSNVSKDTLERAKELLELRVNSLGVSESNVQISGQNRILIEIPGIYDAQEALKTVGKTGKLRFVGPNNDEIITGSDVEDATVGTDSSNQPVVQLKLKSEGATKFAEATQKYINQKISIYMDDDVVSAPTVQSAIPDGNAMITGSKSIDEAKRLAGIIKSGALPVQLTAAQVQTIGPSLGAEAVPTSLKASIIGIAIVMIFMLLYYRLPGFIADLALTVYIMLALLIFVLVLKQTLSLSGIAGFLLSIGMAVDANVLIFERMKEELRVGKSLKNAIDAGFHRALSSIVDSNVTTLIAGFALYFLGKGSVKGFALTLNIGIICSMFTAITVTRFLLKNFVGTGWLTDKKYYGV